MILTFEIRGYCRINDATRQPSENEIGVGLEELLAEEHVISSIYVSNLERRDEQ